MTELAVWAPRADRVDAVIADERIAMHAVESVTSPGWWRVVVPDAGHGTDYAFSLDGGDPRPDPRSRWQPHGVHGPSRVYDHGRYEWQDGAWTGRPLEGSVLYELHVGTFTTDGTLDATIERLDHLVDLGVTTVELLPLAGFDGTAGWGYDGVAPYAVHEPYGGPDALKRFVDAAHQRGLAVVLDVVYNHLGPSGNYLGEFGPYFTDAYATPWGSAVNLDQAGSDEVRRYICDSALSWLRDYHLDGLRLDAVHAFFDSRAVPLLEQLSSEVDVLATHLGRPLPLIAESDLNDPRVVTPREAGGLGVTAQWADDVHHALHALLTGERQGYYADFGSLATAATALTSVFVHAGTWSTFRGRTHGRPVDRARTSGHRFVTYLQDHDQVGNRATGDRLSASVSPGLLKVGAALLLSSPYTPMLFMGEEWAASTPWQFFTSFPDPELGDGVRNGRRSEFAEHGWSSDDVPDPQDPATFEASRLDWSEVEKDDHADVLAWYRRLIALRKERTELADGRLDAVTCAYDEDARWLVLGRGRVAVVANLAADRQEIPVAAAPRTLLAASAPGFVFTPTSVTIDGESVCIVELTD